VTSPDPLAALVAPLRAAPPRAGVFSDFDGTLAAIVDDPTAARPLAGVRAALAELAGRYGRVGVVSGRPAAFLAQHLGAPGVRLSGLYGLESVVDDEVVTAPGAEAWRAVVAGVATRAEHEGPPGAQVERKGLALTLHHRTRPDLGQEVRAWVEAEAARTGLVVHAARRSYELRPPLELDKGTVVAAMAEGLDAVCFLGDDVGDLAAFDALERLGEGGVVVVRIAVRSDEAPPALLARADVVVEGPEAALDVLRRLAA
jgi:trehalose 6-phosphate phosphatase